MVSAEQKRHARVTVLEETVRHLEAGMARWGIPLPPPDLTTATLDDIAGV